MAINAGGITEGRNSLFVDNNKNVVPRMYALTSTTLGWELFEMEESGENSLLETRKLDGLVSHTWRISVDETFQTAIYMDQSQRFDGTIPTTQQIIIDFRTGGRDDELNQSYFWAGPNDGTEWLLEYGIGFQWGMSQPHNKTPGGSRLFKDSAAAGIENGSPVHIALSGTFDAGDGHIGIRYKLTPSVGYPAGTPVAVKWYYDKFGHSPQAECTLISTSSGTIDPDNVIRGMSAYSGVLYTATWDALGDNIPQNRVSLMGFVATTGV